MKFDKYALATEIEENSNLFEVFEIIIFESDSEISKRWKSGTSNQNAIAMNVTGLDNLTFDSFWDGQKFNLPDNKERVVGHDVFDIWGHEENSLSLAFLSKNKIFGRVTKHNDIEKFEAAFSNKVLVIDASDVKLFGLGYIWDGSSFSLPKD